MLHCAICDIDDSGPGAKPFRYLALFNLQWYL